MGSMRHPRLVLLLVVLLVIAGAALGMVLLAPRVIDVVPETNEAVPAGTALQITFSQDMRTDNVQAKLEIQPKISGQYTWEGPTLTFTPNEPWPSGTTVSINLPRGIRAAGDLGLPMLQPFETTFNIAEPQILYLYPSNGPADLYLLNPQSSDTKRLTTVQGGLQSYATTSDGRRIYFATRSGAIYQLDRASGETSLYYDCPQAACSDPQISPDDRFLAFVSTPEESSGPQANPQVWLAPLAGSAPRLVDDQALSTQLPRWSPNGQLVYYDEINQVYLVWNPDTNERRTFPNQTGEPGVWSPDGNSFYAPEIYLIPNAYLSSSGTLEPMPTSHLLRFDVNSGQSTDLTEEDTLEDTSPSISPDGSRLAFARKYLDPARWTPGRQLWVLDTRSGAASALTDAPFYNHSAFNWKPDSSQLLFVRSNQADLSEPPEIWRINADGSDPVRLIIGGYAPHWIP
jgi:Tol biopolymer transport system component